MDTTEAHSFSGRLGLPLRHGLVPLRASLVRAVPAGWSEAQGSVAEEAEVLDDKNEIWNVFIFITGCCWGTSPASLPGSVRDSPR